VTIITVAFFFSTKLATKDKNDNNYRRLLLLLCKTCHKRKKQQQLPLPSSSSSLQHLAKEGDSSCHCLLHLYNTTSAEEDKGVLSSSSSLQHY
jgi:hypothetical protein